MINVFGIVNDTLCSSLVWAIPIMEKIGGRYETNSCINNLWNNISGNRENNRIFILESGESHFFI